MHGHQETNTTPNSSMSKNPDIGVDGWSALGVRARPMGQKASGFFTNRTRQILIGMLLIIALLAFEMFNFDSTQFALDSLFGEVSFIQFHWATILAIAFCAIDFAGLAHLFSTNRLAGSSRDRWYLTGAWFLGATMNAIMTWWAVSLALLAHDFGNELIGREQLLKIVPIFVAILVWLTRVLFIGAFSMAGFHLFGSRQTRKARTLENNKEIRHHQTVQTEGRDRIQQNPSRFSTVNSGPSISYRVPEPQYASNRTPSNQANQQGQRKDLRPVRPLRRQMTTFPPQAKRSKR